MVVFRLVQMRHSLNGAADVSDGVGLDEPNVCHGRPLGIEAFEVDPSLPLSARYMT